MKRKRKGEERWRRDGGEMEERWRRDGGEHKYQCCSLGGLCMVCDNNTSHFNLVTDDFQGVWLYFRRARVKLHVQCSCEQKYRLILMASLHSKRRHIRYSHIYEVHMSPALNKSSEIQWNLRKWTPPITETSTMQTRVCGPKLYSIILQLL